MKTKKKLVTSVAAVVTAAVMVLGGTFAWQSINQTALNEASDVINPGGRLHDDFYIDVNGDYNADIYVENFADDEIFARVRLEEYMEVVINYGTDAAITQTLKGSQGDVDGDNPNVVYDEEGNALYERDYALYTFDSNEVTDADGAATGDYSAAFDGETSWFNWTPGSAASETVYYMPTFNMNKDSLVADRNGMYVDRIGGISNRSVDQYEDYTVWGDGDTDDGTEIYDVDTNWVDEVGFDFENLTTYVDAGNIKTKTETHTAASVGTTNGLISMNEWIAKWNDGEDTSDYWVYDTDGWVYWSSPIAGGETTGLLLDAIELNQVMDDTWYYAINVIGQFCTAGDVDGFYNDGEAPSSNAETLLDEIGAGTGEAADNEEGFVANAGILTGINMSLYANSPNISVDEATNTITVNPTGDWEKVAVSLSHDTLEIILNDTTQAIYVWDADSGDWVEHGEDIVDIEYYEDGLDLLLDQSASGFYKLTANYDDGEGNTYEGSIEFTIEVYDGPGAGESGEDDYEETEAVISVGIETDEGIRAYSANEDGYIYVTGLDQETGSTMTVYVDETVTLAENGFTASFEEIINGTAFTVNENDPYQATLTLAPMDGQSVTITAADADGATYTATIVPIFETIVITPDMDGKAIYLEGGYYTLKAKGFTNNDNVNFTLSGANRTVIIDDSGTTKLSMSSYESAESFTITASGSTESAIVTVNPVNGYPFDGANFSYYVSGGGEAWAYSFMAGRDYLWMIEDDYTYEVSASLITSFVGTIAWKLEGMDTGEAGFVSADGSLVSELDAAQGQTKANIKLTEELSVGETLTLTATILPAPDDTAHDGNGNYTFTIRPYGADTVIPDRVDIETTKAADEYSEYYEFGANEYATFTFTAYDEEGNDLSMTNADFTWSVMDDDDQAVTGYSVLEGEETGNSVTITHTCAEGSCDCPEYCAVTITLDSMGNVYRDSDAIYNAAASEEEQEYTFNSWIDASPNGYIQGLSNNNVTLSLVALYGTDYVTDDLADVTWSVTSEANSNETKITESSGTTANLFVHADEIAEIEISADFTYDGESYTATCTLDNEPHVGSMIVFMDNDHTNYLGTTYTVGSETSVVLDVQYFPLYTGTVQDYGAAYTSEYAAAFANKTSFYLAEEGSYTVLTEGISGVTLTQDETDKSKVTVKIEGAVNESFVVVCDLDGGMSVGFSFEPATTAN